MLYDLTASISPNLVVFPGDPPCIIEKTSDLETGQAFNHSCLHFGNHLGTHVDFPSHILKGHKTSSDFSLDFFMGPGLIIEVSKTAKSISKELVLQAQIQKNDIVFFKTANSQVSKQAPFIDDYVYIEPEAAEAIVEKGAKMVGIDYLSVDAYQDSDLVAHHIFLDKEVLIVECLELALVPEGRYEIFIVPLKVPHLDGVPARVFCL